MKRKKGNTLQFENVAHAHTHIKKMRQTCGFHDKNITFNVLSNRIRIDENGINAKARNRKKECENIKQEKKGSTHSVASIDGENLGS